MQPKQRFRTSQLAVLLAGAVIPISARADQTIAYGVANFGGSGQCPNNSSHSTHNDTPVEFNEVFNELAAAGKWGAATTLTNKSVRGSRFTDPTKTCPGCTGMCSCPGDDSVAGVGADTPDVMFIHSHGRHDPSARSSVAMGNSSFDCSVTTDQNMLWNNNLDIAVLKVCQSADINVWKAGGYGPKFTTPTASLTVWNGFHGDSSCSPFYTPSDVNDYAHHSVQEGVGENWLDEFYMDWVGFNNDDCPVSIVMGDTSAKRDAMFRHGGWRDRKNTGSHNKSSYFFIADCSPDHGAHLPD